MCDTGIIYLYRDFEGKPIYVGQTIQPLKIRHYQHLSRASRTLFDNMAHTYKYNFPEILVRCEKFKLDEMEKYYIHQYNTLFPYGFNLTKGGQGQIRKRDYNTCMKPIKAYDLISNEWIHYDSITSAIKSLNIKNHDGLFACLRKQKLVYHNKIWIYADESIDLSEYSIQIKEELSKLDVLRNITLPSQSKAIYQYNSEGHLLNTFPSISYASKVLGLPRKSIAYAIEHDKEYKGNRFKLIDGKH